MNKLGTQEVAWEIVGGTSCSNIPIKVSRWIFFVGRHKHNKNGVCLELSKPKAKRPTMPPALAGGLFQLSGGILLPESAKLPLVAFTVVYLERAVYPSVVLSRVRERQRTHARDHNRRVLPRSETFLVWDGVQGSVSLDSSSPLNLSFLTARPHMQNKKHESPRADLIAGELAFVPGETLCATHTDRKLRTKY